MISCFMSWLVVARALARHSSAVSASTASLRGGVVSRLTGYRLSSRKPSPKPPCKSQLSVTKWRWPATYPSSTQHVRRTPSHPQTTSRTYWTHTYKSKSSGTTIRPSRRVGRWRRCIARPRPSIRPLIAILSTQTATQAHNSVQVVHLGETKKYTGIVRNSMRAWRIMRCRKP